MKTRTKLLTALIVVLIVALISVVSFAVWRETSTYSNKELVNNVRVYRQIEEEMGKATRVFLPEITFKAPELFKEYELYPYVMRYIESREMFSGVSCKREGEYLFEIRYDLPELSESDTIKICKIWYWDNCRYSKWYIRRKSKDLLELMEKNFRRRLACYNLRKIQEQEFKQESQKLGSKLYQISKVMDKRLEPIRRSTKVNKGFYSFRIPSQSFEYINCTIFYDPDPVFEIVRIELGKSSVQRYFNIGYKKDYKQDYVWGFIDNENTTLESFGILIDVLTLVETKITEDPEIIKAALMAKSVK